MGHPRSPDMPAATTKVWKLQHAPAGEVDDDTFVLDTEEVPELAEGEILVETVYLSNDPGIRSHIQKGANASRTYMSPIREGDVMRAYGIGRVVESRSSKWTAGALVIAHMGWRQLAVLPGDAAHLHPAPLLPGHSPTLGLGYLGSTGLTAWFALQELVDVKPEHTIVISGAAGATGSAAVQIAKKLMGVRRVVAIAGGADKCAWVEALGADVCVDYRAPDFEARLLAATDGFVDTYFDLVGGRVLNLMLPRIKRHGSVAAIGSISAYNDKTQNVITNWGEVITNRLTVRGFIIFDYAPRFPAALATLAGAVARGELVAAGSETVCEVPFEDVPRVWRGLFTGANRGKLVTQLV